ncbi:MAG: aldo/keto reductase [Rivularia sp. (in: Bacteria)]|nr:aldo/keto reductase [Rivularia sp. MS3]
MYVSEAEKYNKINKFTLGTAQLGMDYGIANITGKPSKSDAVLIIKQAVKSGINGIDTAPAYGDAEIKIGEALEGESAKNISVITKLDTFQNFSSDESEKNVYQAVNQSILKSCHNLRTKQIHTLLLHRWEHRFTYQQTIWKALLDLKEGGYINKLGVSVYTPEEAIQALKEPEIAHIQLPFNLIDWRWKASNFFEFLRQRSDVVIHARSVFLQGLLIGNLSTWNKLEDSKGIDWITKLDKLVQELGRENKTDLCLAYVRSQTWINSIVIGVDSLLQLKENIRLFQTPLLTNEQSEIVEEMLGGATDELLNPTKWKINL